MHSLGLHLTARKNLSAQFEAMATVSSPMESGEIKREPLADITNKPKTAEPRAVRRRINPTPIGEASTRERLLHLKAMQFVVAVEQYANEYRVAPLLDMLVVFKAACDAVDDRRTL
ncbi:g6225 [Coccomyxa elongata]